MVPSEASLPLMANGAALLLARGIVHRMAETRTRAVQRTQEPGRAAACNGTSPVGVMLGFAERQLKGAFMAKRATKKSAKKPAAKKRAAKRELISPRGDKRFIRRDAAGRIKESDDVSRSLSQDRRKKAKKAAKPGQGDRGDRKPASKTKARKKTRAKG